MTCTNIPVQVLACTTFRNIFGALNRSFRLDFSPPPQECFEQMLLYASHWVTLKKDKTWIRFVCLLFLHCPEQCQTHKCSQNIYWTNGWINLDLYLLFTSCVTLSKLWNISNYLSLSFFNWQMRREREFLIPHSMIIWIKCKLMLKKINGSSWVGVGERRAKKKELQFFSWNF